MSSWPPALCWLMLSLAADTAPKAPFEVVTAKPLPALTQDELRVVAWAEVREPLELQLAPLGRHALTALAPHAGESVLDIGCGGGETALDLARAVAPDGTLFASDPNWVWAFEIHLQYRERL